jgi:hypothetical protein
VVLGKETLALLMVGSGFSGARHARLLALKEQSKAGAHDLARGGIAALAYLLVQEPRERLSQGDVTVISGGHGGTIQRTMGVSPVAHLGI